jgi:hypothetical protein
MQMADRSGNPNLAESFRNAAAKYFGQAVEIEADPQRSIGHEAR